jgi:hypothetical protein
MGPGPLLIPEIAVALAEGDEGAAYAREYASFYLRAPNYTTNLRRFGYSSDDIEGGGSDRLISRVVPNGPVAAVARIREHLEAGADHVVIQPMTWPSSPTSPRACGVSAGPRGQDRPSSSWASSAGAVTIASWPVAISRTGQPRAAARAACDWKGRHPAAHSM